MNERIRELAHEAGLPTYNPAGIPTKLEKFAELIVNETLRQTAIQMNKFGDEQSNNPAWYKSEDAVKKHFGVEE